MNTETLARVKQAYTNEARRLADGSMTQLERTRVSPNALTIAGVGLSIAASVIVYFEYLAWPLFLVGAAVFVVGSLLDILDGALARSRRLGTPFGAFLDSTFDRVGEAFMLGAIGLVFLRDGKEWAVALAFAAIGGAFLVPYTRARAEALNLRGDMGIGSRAERVVVITAGLALAPIGALPWAVVALIATAWITVAQRIFAVRRQLRAGSLPPQE